MQRVYLFLINKTSLKFLALLFLGILFSCSSEPDYSIIRKQLLGNGYGLGSSTFLVKDLKQARDFCADTLGFSLPKASRFKKGLQKGTVTTRMRFPDMTAIDFISLPDSLVTDETPIFISNFLAKHQGIQKYILSSSSVDKTFTLLTNQGFIMDSVQSYRTSANPAKGWSRDDGGNQESTLDFKNLHTTYLPRFSERVNSDYEKTQKMWRTYYAYNRSFSNHKNGVVGIKAIQIAVDSFEVARNNFLRMGLKELSTNNNKSKTRFKVKRNQELHLSSSNSENDDVAKFLKERGSGVYAIRFEVANLDST